MGFANHAKLDIGGMNVTNDAVMTVSMEYVTNLMDVVHLAISGGGV